MGIRKFFLSVLILAYYFPGFSQSAGIQGSFANGGFRNNFQQNLFKSIDSISNHDQLAAFLAMDPSVSQLKFSRISDNFRDFCDRLKAKKNRKSARKYLEYVFSKVHSQFLKKYELNSPVYSTFEFGNYDCVSGTALYALVLDNLNIPYTIRETKFHVYLLAYYDGKSFLFESTDPGEGLISDPLKIKECEYKYINQQSMGESYYVYGKAINERITLKQLVALELYNKGIASFNNKNILSSLNYFEKALTLYNSPRIHDIFKKTLEVLEKQALYSKSVGLARSYKYYVQVIEEK